MGMQSFRTEIENPVVERDIIELANKIELFQNGKIDEEKFRSLRLARGVYGQRQEGVQMIRIKLPYGKVSGKQLRRIADIDHGHRVSGMSVQISAATRPLTSSFVRGQSHSSHGLLSFVMKLKVQ